MTETLDLENNIWIYDVFNYVDHYMVKSGTRTLFFPKVIARTGVANNTLYKNAAL